MSNAKLAISKLDYDTCKSALEESRRRGVLRPYRIGPNTILLPDGPDYVVRFQSTDIIRFRPDGSFVLNCGSWPSSTTKQRMNRLVPVGYGVFQQRRKWFVQLPGGETDSFFNGWSSDQEERRMFLGCQQNIEHGRKIFRDWLEEKGRHPILMGW